MVDPILMLYDLAGANPSVRFSPQSDIGEAAAKSTGKAIPGLKRSIRKAPSNGEAALQVHLALKNL
jgi:hypothetical protein